MPFWLNLAIGIFLAFWTLVEIATIIHIAQLNNPFTLRLRGGKKVRPTTFGQFQTFIWIIGLILYLCYNLFG